MAVNYESLGRRIRELRESKKWSQAKLAEKSGIEPSTMSHIERAATKVSLPTLINIANALEVTLDELLYGSLIKSSHVTVKMIDNILSDCNTSELKAIAEIMKAIKAILRSNRNDVD